MVCRRCLGSRRYEVGGRKSDVGAFNDGFQTSDFRPPSSFFSLFLTFMHTETSIGFITETAELPSDFLERTVTIDFYLPPGFANNTAIDLLLVNDGQDLPKMALDKLLGMLLTEQHITPLLCAGIHCGEDRLNEYGIASSPDFKGRGAKAGLYSRFVFEELLPFIYQRYRLTEVKQKAFAGFSLGGLSALDIVWNNPEIFSVAGIFSGALWWRSKDKTEREYSDGSDRLMHRQVRTGKYQHGLRFFFECGELDETEDRNRNGVIDSIDDTIDLMKELLSKGYREGNDFRYLQLPDGKHDVTTWGRAMPEFLKWGWGRNK